MKFQNTGILDCYQIETEFHTDSRGYFRELYRRDFFNQIDASVNFVQENESFSSSALTLRGLHMQKQPFDQWKLVRVSKGSILDVVVDVRSTSETYLKRVYLELNEKAGNQLLVPKGCLHGFVTLESNTVVNYSVSAHYDPESEVNVKFDDPFLGIDWGYEPDQLIVSEKDRSAQSYEAWLAKTNQKDKR